MTHTPRRSAEKKGHVLRTFHRARIRKNRYPVVWRVKKERKAQRESESPLYIGLCGGIYRAGLREKGERKRKERVCGTEWEPEAKTQRL